MPVSPRRSGYQPRPAAKRTLMYELRGGERVFFRCSPEEWRGVNYLWDGTGPKGTVCLWESTDGGETWTPGLFFEGDGQRLRPLVCQKSWQCWKQAGHKGRC